MSADSPQFVDTNVLVYAHDTSAGKKYTQAALLLRNLWRNRTGCVSIQVLQEFYVTATRKVKKPLSPETAEQIIVDLSAWRIHSPTADDVVDAIRLQTRHRLSFWDAMILTSARQLGCTTVWSEDLNAGQLYNDVLVLNPFEKYEEQENRG